MDASRAPHRSRLPPLAAGCGGCGGPALILLGGIFGTGIGLNASYQDYLVPYGLVAAGVSLLSAFILWRRGALSNEPGTVRASCST